MQEAIASEIVGSVNDKRRSLIRLFFYDTDTDYLAHVDQACDVPVIFDYRLAHIFSKLTPAGPPEHLTLADGTARMFARYEMTASWFGEPRIVKVYLPDVDAILHDLKKRGRRMLPIADGEPEITIGTPFLEGKIVTTNYATGRFTITRAQ